MSTTLFISDVHLSRQRPAKLALFQSLLNSARHHCEALYILGDLFDVWLGDDDQTPLARAVTGTLAEFVRSGIPAKVLRGNRDFLMDRAFEERTGCRILAEPMVIDLYGEPTLLLHGDSLCTDDLEYQAFRRKLYSKEWKRDFLARSFEERIAIASHIREASDAASSQKPPEIMDVSQGAVVDVMRQHRVRRLIHGHTHRPSVHELQVDGASARRTVLGDWYIKDSVLVATPDSQDLMRVDAYLRGLGGLATRRAG